ncbi:MAG: lytic transglycosylase domain-containing protein [Kiritimatiellia bacterium]
MKFPLAIFIALALAALPAERAAAILGDWELDYERMADTGQAVFERVAPESVRERYEFISAADVAGLFSPLQAALNGESFESIAAYGPQARQTLARLRADPNSQDYADWLEARMDYVDMAAEVERAIPAPKPAQPPPPTSPQPPLIPHPKEPPKPLPPHPSTPQPALIPHPTTPPPPLVPHPQEPAPAAKPAPAPKPEPAATVVAQARNRYVESKQVWLRKLASRPAPARSAALLPDLKRAFQAEGVPAALVWQAEAESTFNPAARSPAGAVGLYQFMPATAQQFGLRLTPQDERLDALKNARAAAKYLKLLHGRFGNWPLAFAAYNCGQGRVAGALRKTGGRTFADIHDKLPAETRMYVPKIAALVQLRESADIERL